MMKTFYLGKATDLYDCGTATFVIAKGNIQSVLTLVGPVLNPSDRHDIAQNTAESGVNPHSINQSIIQWYIPVKSMVVTPPPTGVPNYQCKNALNISFGNPEGLQFHNHKDSYAEAAFIKTIAVFTASTY
jgi:hypothetical protein